MQSVHLHKAVDLYVIIIIIIIIIICLSSSVIVRVRVVFRKTVVGD